jgi:hypothetical protein
VERGAGSVDRKRAPPHGDVAFEFVVEVCGVGQIVVGQQTALHAGIKPGMRRLFGRAHPL